MDNSNDHQELPREAVEFCKSADDLCPEIFRTYHEFRDLYWAMGDHRIKLSEKEMEIRALVSSGMIHLRCFCGILKALGSVGQGLPVDYSAVNVPPDIAKIDLCIRSACGHTKAKQCLENIKVLVANLKNENASLREDMDAMKKG